MDEDFFQRISDYFTPAELVDILDVDMEQLVYQLEDVIIARQRALQEIMEHGC